MLHGCLVHSISECANVPEQFRKEIGGPIKEVIGYFFFEMILTKFRLILAKLLGEGGSLWILFLLKCE